MTKGYQMKLKSGYFMLVSILLLVTVLALISLAPSVTEVLVLAISLWVASFVVGIAGIVLQHYELKGKKTNGY
jgi:predicted neutral ceramidase superfamily lipid hydrolase